MNDYINKVTLVGVLLMLMISLESSANVLHWLSQVEAEQMPVLNGGSSSPKVSTNGRYVTFTSTASNLVFGDNNQRIDFFWHDLQTGETKLVNSTQSGTQASVDSNDDYSAPTSDGQWVAFTSAADNLPDAGEVAVRGLYLKNMITGVVTNHSDYNGGLYFSVSRDESLFLSDDGLFVTFMTKEGIDPVHTGSRSEIYRKDLVNDTFELVSISFDGSESFNVPITDLLDVSDNGRYTLIESGADNAVTQILNNTDNNLYLRDMQTGTTQLINVTPTGDSSSTGVSLSQAGVSNLGQVVFHSLGDDLVVGDTNGLIDVFLFDGSTTKRINLNPSGNQLMDNNSSTATISGDGSQVVFVSNSGELIADYGGFNMLYAYDTQTSSLSMLAQGAGGLAANNNSNSPQLSLNGSVLVFTSAATNLTPAMTSPNHSEVLARQASDGGFKQATEVVFEPDTVVDNVGMISVSSDQMSVIYATVAMNLTDDTPIVVGENMSRLPVNLFLLDRNTNEHRLIAQNIRDFLGFIEPSQTDISASGRYVVFNSISSQPGALVTFDEPQVYLYDRDDESYTLIDQGEVPRVNNEGKTVFQSDKQISNNDTNTSDDVYMFDPLSITTVLISEDTSGNAAGQSGQPDIGGSGDDTWVTFTSNDSALIIGDTNNTSDVFMHNPATSNTIRVSQTAAGVEGNAGSQSPSVSENGQFVSFFTVADNLGGVVNSGYQVMLYDRNSTLLEVVSEAVNPNGIFGLVNFNSVSVSDSGRYVAYTYTDSASSGLPGDADRSDDAVLYDSLTDTSQIVSVNRNGQQVDDFVRDASIQVVEDLSVSPPLVGVVFTAANPDGLTEVAHHPGYAEAFLFQKGGPDVNLNIQVVGVGQISGSGGINCGTACDFDLALGADLTLLAAPGTDHEFRGWHVEFGGCEIEAQNPCEVIMDRNKTVTAYFVDTNDVIFRNGFE